MSDIQTAPAAAEQPAPTAQATQTASRPVTLGDTLRLPCGAVLPNRIAKSAMSEALATLDHKVSDELVRLYEAWSDGGSGLLISGNVMIDRRALGEPKNVVVEDDGDLDGLRRLAQAGTRAGNHFWMQINHPGKQSPVDLNTQAWAPSAIPLKKEIRLFFREAQALTETEIQDLIVRYGRVAGLAKQAGFTGVQIHAAHGYLVSQFLSPLHNQRTDQWGGSLENRMRFVMAVYQSMRDAVGPDFPVGIKLNSADFQKGGFTIEESVQVAQALDAAGIDLIEVSGGTYEMPVVATGLKQSTQTREAYFAEYARQIKQAVKVPVMLTGGFRTDGSMKQALIDADCDVVGLARALVLDLDAPRDILAGKPFRSLVKPLKTGIRMIDDVAMMEVWWYGRQMIRVANGKQPKPHESALWAFIMILLTKSSQAWSTRRLRAN
jgi:2,4-dienoyl-CoA reductase-like NADH-dependent reductase (Old Yellow Enzyme family)